MDMNLRVLRYFLTAAREQSFTKAAVGRFQKMKRFQLFREYHALHTYVEEYRFMI